VKPDLDRLLHTLRDSATDHPRLPDLERLMWHRLDTARAPLLWRRFGLQIRLTAIVAAFLWGVLIGVQGSSAPPQTAGLLLEPAEFLAASAEDLPF
jgi:hypothetical protein